MGATSRANSVRFDESANQGHWAHASRSSLDFMPRSTSSLGGLPMNERSSSHKSDGRASSVHSVRSAASGRASSLNLDTAYGLGEPTRRSPETPIIAPGLLLLGSVPAIIRCWMNTNFKHDSLLYAAIASASYKSHIDSRLIQGLGFEDRTMDSPLGGRVIQLPVYFPEAVPHAASSRSSSPAPQVPTLTIEFNIVDHDHETSDSKTIQIFLGSDALRAHNADILFSSNTLTLYDDDQCKLSIPLVRPENEATFNRLHTTGEVRFHEPPQHEMPEETAVQHRTHLNGLGQNMPGSAAVSLSAASSLIGEKYRPPGVIAAGSTEVSPRPSEGGRSTPERPSSRENASFRPSLSLLGTRSESREPTQDVGSSQSTPAHTSTSPAIWSSWRREAPSQGGQADASSSAKKQETGYQRRDTGIKVLKPTRTNSRAFSGPATASPSPADGRSRFFDEGKRRGPSEGGAGDDKQITAPSLSRKSSSTKENQSSAGAAVGAGTAVRTRTNPAGGASAFSWLNPGGSKS